MKYHFEFVADVCYCVDTDGHNLKDALDKADAAFENALRGIDKRFEVFDPRLIVAEDGDERLYDCGSYSADWVEEVLG